VKMVATRSQTPEAALAHVLDVLGTDTYQPLLVEAGVTDIFDLSILNEEDIRELAYIDPETKNLWTLNRVQVRKMMVVQEWFQAQGYEEYTGWFELTTESLKQYMSTRGRVKRPQQSTEGSGMLQGVKRNITDYPVLKEDKYWMSFNRNLQSLAATHALKEVLDPDYVPSKDEVANFKVKNTFMYSVFTRSLASAKARAYVRKYEDTQDAQKVYKDLLQGYAAGTAANLSSEALEQQLRNMRLDQNWNKPVETFLHTWTSKLHDLETVRDELVGDADRRRWLTAAIKGNNDLYQGVNTAKSVEQAMKGISGMTEINWERFFAMVLDQAQIIDSSQKAQKSRTGRRANQSQRGHNSGKGFIPQEKWAKLSWEERKAILQKRAETRKQKKGRGTGGNTGNSESSDTASRSANTANTQTTESDAGTTAVPTTPSTVPTPSPTVPQVVNTSVNQAQRLVNQAATSAPDTIVLNGVTYRASVTRINYHVSQTQTRNSPSGSLVDRGANGGLSGSDVRVLEESTSNFADVTGIMGVKSDKLPLCTVAGILDSEQGPIIGIFHHYAHLGEGHTLHSPLQLEDFGVQVDDRSRRLGLGDQCVTVPEGHRIPLKMVGGLAYMPMRPPTDEELDQLPHVTMTCDKPWDPSRYDDDNSETESVCPGESEDMAEDLDVLIESCLLASQGTLVYKPKSILASKPDYEVLRPYFGWIPTQRVKDTIECTTQYYRADARLPMRKHFKSRFPGANVPRRDETVAMDSIFSDTPALDDGIPGHGGCTILQYYVGCRSQYSKGYPMASETAIPQTLQDFIRHYGAPNALFNDNAKAEISKKVQDILRHFYMKQYRSEPHQQNQNPAERRIQDMKKHTNMLLDRTGAPASMWLLCTLYVIDLHNHLAGGSSDITPIQKAFGYTPDISKFLQFHWWQRVLYRTENVDFPSSTYEGIGRFVGVAENVGDALTYMILTDDTQQVIYRSMVRPLDPKNPNVRVLHPEDVGEDDGEPPVPIVKSITDCLDPEYDPEKVKLPKFSPDELLGLPFCMTLQMVNEQGLKLSGVWRQWSLKTTRTSDLLSDMATLIMKRL